MLSALVYMVRIPGFHPGGPGSIPGCGIFVIIFNLMYFNIKNYYEHSSKYNRELALFDWL